MKPRRALALVLAAGCADEALPLPTGTTAEPTPEHAWEDLPAVDYGIISARDESAFEAETVVAATDSGRVCAVWRTFTAAGARRVGYAFSEDGGTTWAEPGILEAPPGRFLSDPVVAAGPEGEFRAAWIDHAPLEADVKDLRIFTARAAPAATKFGSPEAVSDPSFLAFNDKPWLAITRAGTVLIAWQRPNLGPKGQGASVVIGRREQGGPWERFESPSDMSSPLPYVCAAPDNSRRYVVYRVGAGGLVPDEAIVLVSSNDDGRTWSPPIVVADKAAAGDRLAGTMPSCAARGDEVWVSYGVTPGPHGFWVGLGAVQVAHSTTGGASFAAPTIADDLDGYSLLPQLALSRIGTLALVRYAGQSKGAPDGAFRLATSSDGGHAFGPSTPVHEPVTLELNRYDKTTAWLGDYVGVVAKGHNVLTTFAVNESGHSHVAFVRAVIP